MTGEWSPRRPGRGALAATNFALNDHEPHYRFPTRFLKWFRTIEEIPFILSKDLARMGVTHGPLLFVIINYHQTSVNHTGDPQEQSEHETQ